MEEQLKQLLEHNPSRAAVIIQAIELYEKALQEQYTGRCMICGEKMSADEKNSITPHDFLITCSNHRKYRSVFQASIIRKQLGYPEFGETIIDRLKAVVSLQQP